MAERIAIVVVGMHRSGSSAMARLLSLAGATLPNGLMHAGDGNETGHWEPQRVADYNDVVLAAFDAAWDSPFGLGVNATRRAALNPFIEGARTIIREEYGDASLIVLKEPRISLVADLWIEALEAEGYSCKFVITVRPPTEAASSLRKRNGFALDKGLLLWGAYVASAELLTRAHDRVFCRYDDVLVRPASVLDDIEAKLRIELPRRTAQAHAAMDAFVRPVLKHNDAMTIPPIPPHLRPISELSDYIHASIVGEFPNMDISSNLQAWFSDLDQTITPLVLGIEQRLRHEQESAIAAANGQVEAYRLDVDRLNALYHGQLADIARLNAQLAEVGEHRRDAEQRLAEVEQARLATQACLDQREAEIARLEGEANAARVDWHDRETALVQHANGLAEAREHAVRDHAATLAQVELRHEEERAVLLTASQARIAESDAALAAAAAVAQDAARVADETITALRDALAQAQEDATARITDLQQQVDVLRAAKVEGDAAAAQTIAELTQLNDHMARTHAEDMAAVAVRLKEREATLAEANAALAAQAAETARVEGEANAARVDWHDREAALVQHANGLAEAREHAARDHAATLAQVEQRHEEQRAALLTASQARIAESDAALAAAAAVAQDAARVADETITALRDALAQAQEDATARNTDLQHQVDVLRAAQVEQDAVAAQTIADLTQLNDYMAGAHAEDMAAVAVRLEEREATLEQLATARNALEAEIGQQREVEAGLRHAVAELTQDVAQRDETVVNHASQVESLIETIADLNRARVAQDEALAAEVRQFRDREDEMQLALAARARGGESILHRLKAVFISTQASGDIDKSANGR